MLKVVGDVMSPAFFLQTNNLCAKGAWSKKRTNKTVQLMLAEVRKET